MIGYICPIIPSMSTKEILLARILAFCEQHNMSEREFGIASVRNHKLVKRIRDGLFSNRTADRVHAYIDSVEIRPPEDETSASDGSSKPPSAE
jgi:hypothetical protein